jgi:lycopene beta-cyclase
MIYREFLLFLLAPPIALAVVLFVFRYRSACPSGRNDLRLGVVVTGALSVVAVVYTTPWDRWLITNSVWSYPPGSVLGTIVDVPVEEFVFMIGLTVLTGLWTLAVIGRPSVRPMTASSRQAWRRPAHAVGWLLAACAGGVLAATQDSAAYLGSMLLWFGPLLALQAAVGADVLRAGRARRLAGLSITVLLWTADAIAIHSGAWRISPAHTVGLEVLGLPLEEAIFFLTVNLLIVNSLVLMTAPQMRARLSSWLRRAGTTSHRP